MTKITKETQKMVNKAERTQKRIEKLNTQLQDIVNKIIVEVDVQKTQVVNTARFLSDNERYYRDTLHMIELGENLTVADQQRLFAQLQDAVHARRLGKDLLFSLGMDIQEVTNVYNQGSNAVTNIPHKDIPVVEANRRLKSTAGQFKSQIQGLNTSKDFKLRFRTTSDNRAYLLRSRENTPQRKIIVKNLDQTKLIDKKYSAVKQEMEEMNGNISN